MRGIGVDEHAAAVVEGQSLRVIGSGAVYVVDGEGLTHSNVAEASPEQVLSMHEICMHVLAAENSFDLDARRPTPAGK